MDDSKEISHWMTKVDRRSGEDRRQFSYTFHIPERRSGNDRRSTKRRGKGYLVNIEDDGKMRTEEVRHKKSDVT